MPTFVVKTDEGVMKVVKNTPVFILDARRANTYPSRYAAKRHLKQLDNVPENVKIVELLTIEDNVHG